MKDVQIPVILCTCDLWFVKGIDGWAYPTKIAAEVAARARYPHEPAALTYNRIYFKRFMEENYEG